jgi:hypothetical protein
MAPSGRDNRRNSPTYNVQWGWNFASGNAKVQLVAYVIRAAKRGRVVMCGFMPASASAGSLYGCIGRISGEGGAATAVNGAAIFQYGNDSSLPANGVIQATSDLGLGTLLDGWLQDPTNTGFVMASTSEGAGVPLSFPFTLLAAGGPEPGPFQGKDAFEVEPGDLIAMIVLTTSPASGSFQAELDGRPLIIDPVPGDRLQL